MRIALVHIRHAETGGVERFQNHLAAHLAERGHEITLLCRRHGATPHPRVRVEKLHGFALGKTWRIWTFARDVERHLREHGYDVVVGLGRTWRQDVLRLGAGLHASYLERAHASKLSGLERLAGGGWSRHRLVLAIERLAFADPGLKRVIANSRMVARDVERRYGVGADRLRVLHNGVDVERFHPRQRHGSGDALRRELGLSESLVVLFLGTGFGRKGLDLALAGFARLRRERPDARLVVVGQDAAPGRFRALAERLGVAGATLFLGQRSDAEVCYGAADLYLLPTRYDPFANSTVEALASGLPVVTTSANGGSEVIDQCVQGSVVPLEDARDARAAPDALGAELLYWSDPDRRAGGALAARVRAEEHRIETKMAAAEELLCEAARTAG